MLLVIMTRISIINRHGHLGLFQACFLLTQIKEVDLLVTGHRLCSQNGPQILLFEGICLTQCVASIDPTVSNFAHCMDISLWGNVKE